MEPCWPASSDVRLIDVAADIAASTGATQIVSRSTGWAQATKDFAGVELSLDQGRSWDPLYTQAWFPVTVGKQYFLRRVATGGSGSLQIRVFSTTGLSAATVAEFIASATMSGAAAAGGPGGRLHVWDRTNNVWKPAAATDDNNDSGVARQEVMIANTVGATPTISSWGTHSTAISAMGVVAGLYAKSGSSGTMVNNSQAGPTIADRLAVANGSGAMNSIVAATGAGDGTVFDLGTLTSLDRLAFQVFSSDGTTNTTELKCSLDGTNYVIMGTETGNGIYSVAAGSGGAIFVKLAVKSQGDATTIDAWFGVSA